ncbi:hypothetical protein [Bifidobacterium imperatoris]|nr:hypothetical protein [Bifidobacterium imperatoris]
MNELGETLCSFRDIDSESIELMSMKLILLGWHKSKDNDKGERL